MNLTSHDFEHGSTIPEAHSKKGGDISPDLAWTGMPDGTRSLVLIVDDPDAPSGLFTHWLLYGLDPSINHLPKNIPTDRELPKGVRQGENGFGDIGYGGPQPPSGTHRYYFHLYALDTVMDLPAGLTRQQVDSAIRAHIIEEAVLMGRYQAAEMSRTA
jgi:Raf kinase inhibitor-like YbhB/YbcL family protein